MGQRSNSCPGLSPGVLADTVIARMDDLPRAEDMRQEDSRSVGHKSGNALLAGLMQVAPATALLAHSIHTHSVI